MPRQSPIPPLTESKAQRKTISRNAFREHRERLTHIEKLAVFITEHVGTMGFFFIVFVWTAFWISWNIFAPNELKFDPFPAFVFWLFISNMVQLFLMPLLMVGQNLQNKYDETRSQADFEVNLKAEREIELVLRHLEEQRELIVELKKEIEGNGK